MSHVKDICGAKGWDLGGADSPNIQPHVQQMFARF